MGKAIAPTQDSIKIMNNFTDFRFFTIDYLKNLLRRLFPSKMILYPFQIGLLCAGVTVLPGLADRIMFDRDR